jgi:hypothetical protein
MKHNEEKSAFVKFRILAEANIQTYLWRMGTVVSEHTMSYYSGGNLLPPKC